MSLEDKRAVVVGGSSGMGLATAQALADAGAQVVLVSRSQEKLDRARALVGPAAETQVLDMTSESDVVAYFRACPRFDHLVITASDAALGPFLEMPVDVGRSFFDSKFWGPYVVAKYGAPRIRSGGSITLFSGIGSQKPFPGLSVGGAINAAVEALGRSLAVELAPVRVNTVSPGYVRTPAWDGMPEDEREAFFQATAEQLPAGRVGSPDDIAQATLMLIQNGFATGTVLYVDGGHLQI